MPGRHPMATLVHNGCTTAICTLPCVARVSPFHVPPVVLCANLDGAGKGGASYDRNADLAWMPQMVPNGKVAAAAARCPLGTSRPQISGFEICALSKLEDKNQNAARDPDSHLASGASRPFVETYRALLPRAISKLPGGGLQGGSILNVSDESQHLKFDMIIQHQVGAAVLSSRWVWTTVLTYDHPAPGGCCCSQQQ
eukprot:1140388-Pelagomonas_calceolata.AAC.5